MESVLLASTLLSLGLLGHSEPAAADADGFRVAVSPRRPTAGHRSPLIGAQGAWFTSDDAACRRWPAIAVRVVRSSRHAWGGAAQWLS